MDRKIDKAHWQHARHIYPTMVRQGETEVTQEQIEKAIALRPKDNHPHDPRRDHYPILSNHFGGYQMDLLEQSKNREKNRYPAFFLIFIDTNTRWAAAIPLGKRSFAKMRDKVNLQAGKSYKNH